MAGLSFNIFGKKINLLSVAGEASADQQQSSLLSQLGRLIDASANEIYMFDPVTLRLLQVNQGACNNLGYSRDELIGMHIGRLNSLTTLSQLQSAMDPLFAGEIDTVTFESDLLRKDGTTYPIEIHVQLMTDEDPPVFICQALDVSKRHETEKNLREAENRLANAVRLASVGSFVWDVGTDAVTRSGEDMAVHGLSADNVINFADDYFDYMPDKDRDRLSSAMQHCATEGVPVNIIYRFNAPDGSTRYIQAEAGRMPDTAGDQAKVTGITRDVTKAKEAEETITLLGRIIDASANEVYVFDPETLTMIQANDATCQNLGISREDIVGMPIAEFNETTAAGELDAMLQPLLDGSENLVVVRTENTRTDGSVYPVETRVQLISEEDPPVMISLALDITERQKAEQLLRQAEMSEAIGKLSGGMAHDFNNLLAVIIGNLDLALGTRSKEAADELLKKAVTASESGAELISQLLAYSRQSPMRPKSLDLSEPIEKMINMLHRTLGVTIEINVHKNNKIPAIEIDQTLYESTLLNLAINARDAMPSGGKLDFYISLIKTEELPDARPQLIPAGEYILVRVSDTGCGMSDDVIDKIFDPFFTTKDIGQGSGLGLSSVHGFMRQSGGYVAVESEPDAGTTFSLFFPLPA